MIFGALGVLFCVGALLLTLVFGPFLLIAGPTGVQMVAWALMLLIPLGIGSVAEAVGGYDMRQRLGNGWWLLATAIGLGLLIILIVAAIVLVWLPVWIVLGWLNWLLGGIVISLLLLAAVGYLHLQVKPSYNES
jgi:hypothetical protein